MKTWGKFVDMMNSSLAKEPLPLVDTEEEEDGFSEIDPDALEERLKSVMARMMGKTPIQFAVQIEPNFSTGILLSDILLSPLNFSQYMEYRVMFNLDSDMGAFLCAYCKDGQQRVEFVSRTAKEQLSNRTIAESIKDTAKCVDLVVREEMVPRAKCLREAADLLGEDGLRRVLDAANYLQMKGFYNFNVNAQIEKAGVEPTSSIELVTSDDYLVNFLPVYRKENLDAIISLPEESPRMWVGKMPIPYNDDLADIAACSPYRTLPRVATSEVILAFVNRVTAGFDNDKVRNLVASYVCSLCNKLITRFWSPKHPLPITDAYVSLTIKNVREAKSTIILGTEDILPVLFPEDWQRFYIPELCKYKKGSWSHIDDTLDRIIGAILGKRGADFDAYFDSQVLSPGLFFQPYNNSPLEEPQACTDYLRLNELLDDGDSLDDNPDPSELMGMGSPRAMKAAKSRGGIPNWMKVSVPDLGPEEED